MRILKKIICELMIGYGQFLLSLVGQVIFPVVFAILGIVLMAKVEGDNTWLTRFITLFMFLAFLYFHYKCIDWWIKSKRKSNKEN